MTIVLRPHSGGSLPRDTGAEQVDQLRSFVLGGSWFELGKAELYTLLSVLGIFLEGPSCRTGVGSGLDLDLPLPNMPPRGPKISRTPSSRPPIRWNLLSSVNLLMPSSSFWLSARPL